MPSFLSKNADDAINILKHDHDKVKGLFEAFEKAEKLAQKKKIVAEAILELKIHATIEEELFYASVRGEKKVEKDVLSEADEEHHVAKLLMAELEQMDGTEDHYDAKFTVLAENVKHHIKEEEGELFPQARKTEVDFDALGQQLLARKKELLKNGVPPCAEEIMIAAQAKDSDDSPAKTAKTASEKTIPAKASKAAKPAPSSKTGKKSGK